MRKCTVVLSCLLAALAAFAPARARAQSTCTANTATCSPSATNLNITITIGRAIYMALSPANTTLTVPSVTDYNNGYADTTGPTVTVYANTAFSVSLKAAAATWTATPTGTEPVRANKPASDLQYALVAGGPFTDLTTTAVTLYTSPIAQVGLSGAIYYRTKYAWTLDTPGNYSLGVVMTMTSP